MASRCRTISTGLAACRWKFRRFRATRIDVRRTRRAWKSHPRIPASLQLSFGSPVTERWPSGRRRLIGIQVYGNPVSWVRIPPSPPVTRTARSMRVVFVTGAGCVDEPTVRLGSNRWTARSRCWRENGPRSGPVIPPSPPVTRTARSMRVVFVTGVYSRSSLEHPR